MKVCTVQPGLLFPQAVQAMETKRRHTHRRTGKVQTKTIYAVTSLRGRLASAHRHRTPWSRTQPATAPLGLTA
ncbi:hypothetical protein [Streptomyces sp. NPDC005760]|uniref:hypothetical protein n=1 Tax=Streptomyces sp. NPDC005760 TaxID=3156718 RepID=UPI0033C28C88